MNVALKSASSSQQYVRRKWLQRAVWYISKFEHDYDARPGRRTGEPSSSFVLYDGKFKLSSGCNTIDVMNLAEYNSKEASFALHKRHTFKMRVRTSLYHDKVSQNLRCHRKQRNENIIQNWPKLSMNWSMHRQEKDKKCELRLRLVLRSRAQTLYWFLVSRLTRDKNLLLNYICRWIKCERA